MRQLFSIIIITFFIATTLSAQTEYYVSTSGSDVSGTGSSSSPWATLQHAIDNVSDPSTANIIHVATGTYTETVSINRSFKNLTISGAGAETTTIQAASTSSTASNRVFTITNGQTILLSGMTIRYGKTPANENGGGVYNGTGALTVTNCSFIDNEAASFGGGVYNEGTVNVSNSTFSGNSASNCGGGYADYDGVKDEITNCTFFNNNSNNGAGIFLNSDSSPASSYFVTNCSVVGNATPSGSGEGGGIFIMGGTLSIKNTILANNKASGSDNDFYTYQAADVTDNGYNIVEVVSSNSNEGGGYSFSATGDLTGTSLTLNLSSTLEDNNTNNGTQTLKTTSSSVAINAGNSSANGTVSVPTQDQRGASRNGTTDIGAYEYYDNSGSTPVELTSFSAKAKNGIVKLNWTTATEVNNYGFQVEREKAKGESEWENIGFVEGHGNSNSPKEYSFTDENPPSGNLKYRLKQIDIDGNFEYSEIVEIQTSAPSKFELFQNYPNPFNPTTTINYAVPAVETRHALSLQLIVYDILGRKVATLVNKKQAPGNYSVQFDASKLSSGIYFYRLSAGDFIATKKMILMK